MTTPDLDRHTHRGPGAAGAARLRWQEV